MMFHAYSEHRKVGEPFVGPVRLDEGTLTDDPELIANRFFETFATMFGLFPNKGYVDFYFFELS